MKRLLPVVCSCAVGVLIVTGCSESVTRRDPIRELPDRDRLEVVATDPSVAPDAVYYERSAYQWGDPFGVWRLDSVTGKTSFVVSGARPAISRSERLLAVQVGQTGIRLLDLESRESRHLVWSGCFQPEWLPNESGLLFTQTAPSDSAGVWLIELSTGERRRLSGRRGKDPSASPDGSTIAYFDWDGVGGEYDLVLQDLTTGNREVLFSVDVTQLLYAPQWSPSGDRLLLGSLRGLYVVSVADGVLRWLDETVEPRGAIDNWYTGDWLSENEIVFNREELWRMNLETGEISLLDVIEDE